MSDEILDLKSARAMFSRPDSEVPRPTQRRTQKRDGAAQEAAEVQAAGDGWEGTDKMAVMLARKKRQKYAVLNNGDDAILLFGKHKDSKVSRLAAMPDGRDYLRWMLGQEFAPELLAVVRQWLART